MTCGAKGYIRIRPHHALLQGPDVGVARIRYAGRQGRNKMDFSLPIMELGKFRNAGKQLDAGAFIVGRLNSSTSLQMRTPTDRVLGAVFEVLRG